MHLSVLPSFHIHLIDDLVTVTSSAPPLSHNHLEQCSLCDKQPLSIEMRNM